MGGSTRASPSEMERLSRTTTWGITSLTCPDQLRSGNALVVMRTRFPAFTRPRSTWSMLVRTRSSPRSAIQRIGAPIFTASPFRRAVR